MLLSLYIENFALIDKLSVNFDHGLNVLTGETGAGKSILIDAVSIALGERADKSYIRSGCDKSTIQLVFESCDAILKKTLDENGIQLDDGNLIIMTREIYINGRNICRINDKVVTVSLLKQVSQFLIDIHGQHEHQSLLYADTHLELLDVFGDQQIITLRKSVEKEYHELRKYNTLLSELCGNELERERTIDLLKFQLEEIDQCKLKVNEEDQLIYELNLLSNSENIYSVMSKAYEMSYGGENRYPTILDQLSQIVKELDGIKDFDEKITNIHSIFQESLFKLEDVSRDVRKYRDSIEFDPAQLEQIEKRLEIIHGLKRKYGKTVQDILAYRNKIHEELETLINSEALIQSYKDKISEKEESLRLLSGQLSSERKKSAIILKNKIKDELDSLNMGKVTFEIHIHPNYDKNEKYIYSSKGIDKVEFLISTNLGEPVKPIHKIASGGEMSRIMLAFKTILAKTDNIPTLIFDEIDTGISGRTANVVGEKLAVLSKTHQILCITHLPQIAQMADHHYYIEKVSNNEQTVTKLTKIDEHNRVLELARLLGGITVTDLTLKHAKEMLKLGNEYKKRIV
ncbi:MAG: DNA repair protein RecN [Bacillota bacterium]